MKVLFTKQKAPYLVKKVIKPLTVLHTLRFAANCMIFKYVATHYS